MSAPEPITEETHAAALAEIERLIRLDPAAGTPDAEKLQELAGRVQAYERDRWFREFELTGEDGWEGDEEE